jgi:2-methylcitrate dehydratase
MLDDYDGILAALTRRILAPQPAADEDETATLQAGRLELIVALAQLFEAQQGGAPAACLGPVLPGATLVGGARVPGTSLELEPSQAAYCVAWLSANARIGALLPLADYLARRAVMTGVRPPRLAALLLACAQARALAHDIVLPAPQGGSACASQLATRVALAGVAARLLGASDAEVACALSLAFAEGLAPTGDDGARACAAAASTALRVALLARAGAAPIPNILSVRPHGLEASLLGGGEIVLRPGAGSPVTSSEDPLLVWHRFELAVRARFNERQAARLLAAVHTEAALEAMPLQSFVALLVRPS